jgi:hypothetical protein
VTAPTAPADLTVVDDAVPLGPLTVVQDMAASGFAAIAQLHDEAMETIAALAEGRMVPVEEVRVLRMTERPALAFPAPASPAPAFRSPAFRAMDAAAA